MNQTQTSFAQLFGKSQGTNHIINKIEIPLIQRDYAQGRHGEVVERIRKNFLDALYNAVMPGGEVISLDFVYGDVEGNTLYPLDGQQRLTTLFLLHWYLAWRADVIIETQPWRQFTYATRPSARQFCESLVKFRPPTGEADLCGWMIDQAWYFHTWEHDSSIRSMLVMLEALHQRFGSASDTDCMAAWQRLTDPQQPAIGFHLLPITANGLTNDLYIKMNSRGKPLTAFENFKAHFEAVLKTDHPEKADDFANKIDTQWADTLWAYRGDDHLIDDEFMRYFRFVSEVCSWQDVINPDDKTSADALAEQVYGAGNAKAGEHLEFLFKAFDVWHLANINAEFSNLFTDVPGKNSVPLLLFNAFSDVSGPGSGVDLFGACCQHFGQPDWTLSHTLLLYAVLLHRIHDTQNFSCQLRIVRNLIEASVGGEIRNQKMPELLADVRQIVLGNTLQGVLSFNQAQVANENDKAALLAEHPTLKGPLYSLEDQRLLRGCLAAFELDPTGNPSLITQRADAFYTLFNTSACWPQLTGALLALGDYSRKDPRWTGYSFCDFGAPRSEKVWRDLFKGRPEQRLSSALMNLLDQVAENHHDLTCLETIQEEFLNQCQQNSVLDWRYYLVKYPAMREGASGRYAISPSGFSICMLEKTVMRSYYRDPYLLAIFRESAIGQSESDLWFSGYETEPRRISPLKSDLLIECVDQGWQITGVLTDPKQKACFEEVCALHGLGPDLLYCMPQKDGGDIIDRVVMGAQLLKNLIKAGL